MMRLIKFIAIFMMILLLIGLSALGYVWARGNLQSYLPVVQRAPTVLPSATATSTPVPTTIAPTQTPMPSPTAGAGTRVITYALDRTAVPNVSFHDLTINIFVGNEAVAELVDGSGAPIPYTYDPSSGNLTFTTIASQFRLTFVNEVTNPSIGAAAKAALKDDKNWAWSHGLDDNFHLRPSVDLLESKGWQGTLFMIANIIDPARDEDWSIDEPAIRRYLANGWSLGNHTWAHECDGEINFQETILMGYNRLNEIVLSSSRPDYVLTSFAAPCFLADYHSHILQIRDAGQTTILFNESGGPFLTLVDEGATENYVANEKTAVPFNVDAPIGRDTRIEWDIPAALNDIDWIASNTNANRHIWYNTLTHGNNQQALAQIVNHIDSNYRDSVWVAPSDQIYSYILVRNNTELSWDSPLGATPTPTATPVAGETPTPNELHIEVANISGVSGYEIGIFGAKFGAAQGSGSVTIANTPATILEWRDTFIRAVVPAVADGDTTLVVSGSSGESASSPFTVYSIDPTFLTPPDTTYVDIAHGRPLQLQNLESYVCFAQPGNTDTPPTTFLTDYRCGFNGVTDSGSAVFHADAGSNETAVLAVEFDSAISGEHVFQFFTDSNWYPDGGGNVKSPPSDYTLQVSSNSTNGIDGSWETVATVEDNGRLTRLHKISIPNSNHTWFRMRVTDGLFNQSGEAGNDFEIKEIRLYKANASSNRPDSIAIYGDSLTFAAYEAIGPSGLAAKLQAARGNGNNPIFTAFGLVGQSSFGLLDTADNEAEIYDALAIDDMQSNALYWGVALGTNDTFGGGENLGNPNSNVNLYDDRLEAVVQHLLANGRIPILARLPDTVEANGGFGDLATKKKLAEDIDTLAARYRLIPGPDLYTAFRYNKDFEGATYFNNDGTHHTPPGEAKLIELWVQALAP